MSTARYVHWQDQGMWLGYFEAYPDYITQGERPFAPRGATFDAAVADWRTLITDDEDAFDRRITLDAGSLVPQVTWGTNPSMTVDVTGDPGAIGRLSIDRDAAVGLAVKQCLVNVLRHAQVARAEVVIIGSDTDVSIMVIDAGRGFSEDLVASDRLGLRHDRTAFPRRLVNS